MNSDSDLEDWEKEADDLIEDKKPDAKKDQFGSEDESDTEEEVKRKAEEEARAKAAQ